jgi:hypothetical protein
MYMTPQLQERHFDYVLGPNQDARLANVAAGAEFEDVDLILDTDAPFLLRGRAVRQSYTNLLTQNGLQFLKTKWTGPNNDFRQQDLILESLQMAYFGQGANPKPIFPQIYYPAGSTLRVHLRNMGAGALTNLTFYFRGVKLFPPGTVPGYTYPPTFAGLTFSYPFTVLALGAGERRYNQVWINKTDADFVLRAGQAGPVAAGIQRTTLAEVFFRLKDHTYKPFSNDFVHIDILFGSGNMPGTIPAGPVPAFVPPIGTGPGLPGLFYPEIYVPTNHQLFYYVMRADPAGNVNVSFNFIGGKVFPK